MEKRYFYRCAAKSVTGKRLRKLLNDCQKAERAQMEFGRRCGAESVVPVDSAFEGGVVGVVFADDAAVNRTVWKEITKDERDGKTIWRPNCEHREGAVVAKGGQYRPKSTATRVYQYRQRGWEEVRHLFPDVAENGHGMHGDGENGHGTNGDGENGHGTNGRRFIVYTELYREDTEKAVRDMSKLQREAISLERERMMLPVVTPQRVFATLQADMMADAKEGQRFRVVKPETPTFWVYDGWWYVGCSFPCRAEGLEEISSEAYVSKRTDILRMQRDMELLSEE